mmetsp:Transcript_45722/g.76195  ORF Transcript_45722/g.76195 Transcript_45722/m.76195 type:complete len:224 (-) Transcript_45722:298-969(-)
MVPSDRGQARCAHSSRMQAALPASSRNSTHVSSKSSIGSSTSGTSLAVNWIGYQKFFSSGSIFRELFKPLLRLLFELEGSVEGARGCGWGGETVGRAIGAAATSATCNPATTCSSCFSSLSVLSTTSSERWICPCARASSACRASIFCCSSCISRSSGFRACTTLSCALEMYLRSLFKVSFQLGEVLLSTWRVALITTASLQDFERLQVALLATWLCRDFRCP